MVGHDHERYMQRAIELARQRGDRPFATVIVDRNLNQIVSEGWNRSSENPIWHGEIDAINKYAAASRFAGDRQDLVLYTTAEPCPMCQSAILWARIQRVVFGSSIATLAGLGWDQIDISAAAVIGRSDFQQCELIGGVLQSQCDLLYQT